MRRWPKCCATAARAWHSSSRPSWLDQLLGAFLEGCRACVCEPFLGRCGVSFCDGVFSPRHVAGERHAGEAAEPHVVGLAVTLEPEDPRLAAGCDTCR